MHILLVEDNPSDVRVLKDLIEEEGHEPFVYWVMNGHEALDYVFQRHSHEKAQKPDVVLLDLGLPRISGYDVLKELKHHPEAANIPVVILTTSRNPLDIKQCESLGADAFISKPRNLNEYRSLVHTLFSDRFPEMIKATRH